MKNPFMAAVSPGFTPRPWLSDRRSVGAGRRGARRVAGVHAPALVERPRTPACTGRWWVCRRGSRPGLG